MTADEFPTELRIPLTAAIRADVERAAAVESQSVEDWARSRLEQAATIALQRAAERHALAEANQNEADAKADRVLDQMLKKHRGE